MRRLAEHPVRWALMLAAAGLILGGAAFSFVEPSASLPDGWWWAYVSMTTVGYGDLAPKTDTIRVIATFVIATGIGATTILGAALAGRIAELRIRRWKDTADLDDDVDHIVGLLQELQAKVRHPLVREALREAHQQEGDADAS